MVVLKGMFRLKELEDEPELLLELKEDVREEAETLGEVTSVILYDVGRKHRFCVADVQKEDDGVMTIKFKDPVAAQACLSKMDGRYFGGRRVSLEGCYSQIIRICDMLHLTLVVRDR